MGDTRFVLAGQSAWRDQFRDRDSNEHHRNCPHVIMVGVGRSDVLDVQSSCPWDRATRMDPVARDVCATGNVED